MKPPAATTLSASSLPSVSLPATVFPSGWSLVHTLRLPAREGITVSADSLDLGDHGRRFVSARYPRGLYGHQHLALESLLSGRNVVVSTPTASGKSAIFQTAAIERLSRDPKARVLALYPTKALGAEQAERWRTALKAAGLEGGVGLIDGDVPPPSRNRVCEGAQVLIATPDVVHSWLLPKVGVKGYEGATRFLAGLALVIVDEAHTYSGIFGSNCGFLFRRLGHLVGVLGGALQWVACSATMVDAGGHLQSLTGRPFEVVGEEHDTSERHEVTVEMVAPPSGADYHSGLPALLRGLRDNREQFIAFLDSRKAAEQLAVACERESDSGDDAERFEHLLDATVLPYRAGYEAGQRKMIQDRLTEGSLKGVVSTSSLELGVDLPHLKTVVLVGVPHSGTHLRQRVGRVGRSGKGRVIIVNTGSLCDAHAFAEPARLFDRPLHASTIHLGNRRIQYSHAMALAGITGEHGRAALAAGASEATLSSTAIGWPEGFVELCDAERSGVIPRDLQDMRRDAGDQPTRVFPLRGDGKQFTIVNGWGSSRDRIGFLTHEQVMHEAYPGAIYLHAGRPYRVTSVNDREGKVTVREWSHGSTRPIPVCARVTPQREIYGGRIAGELRAVSCELQLWRAVLGFSERSGSGVKQVSYPCERPVRFERGNFARTTFTTGVLLAHPALETCGVDHDLLARLLMEAYRLVVPIELQDVGVEADVLRTACPGLEKGRRIIALFDQASGGLRITARLADPETLKAVLAAMVKMVAARGTVALRNEERAITEATREALGAMLADASGSSQALPASIGADVETGRLEVIVPRGLGVTQSRPSDRFEVHKVFNHPTFGVCYRGVFIAVDGARSAVSTIPIEEVTALPGTAFGEFDPTTDEIEHRAA